MNITEYLISNDYLKTAIIIEAFLKIKRIDFLPEEIKDLHESDQALSIGNEQTISQPAVVAFMLELLQSKKGDKILDIGSGSGWTTALLSYIVGREGKVFAIEVIPELKEFGERNIAKYNFIERGITKFFCADGTKGLKNKAPFDKILVSAAAKIVPEKLKEQLKNGGRLVIPVKDGKRETFFSQSIWLVEKKDENNFETKKTPGFVFVPLVERKQ